MKKTTPHIKDTFWLIQEPVMRPLDKNAIRRLYPSHSPYWSRAHYDWKFWAVLLSTTGLTFFYAI